MRLPNITIAEYIAIEDKEEYDFALKYAEEAQSRDVLGYGDMTKKSFGEVKDYQYLFQKPDCLIRFVEKYGHDKLQNLSVFDFFAFFRYITGQIERITKIENQLLSYNSSADEAAAGLDRFAKYGNFSQLNSLAGGSILNFEAVRNIVYEDALTKLAYDKDMNEYQKDYMNVINRKAKHNG